MHFLWFISLLKCFKSLIDSLKGDQSNWIVLLKTKELRFLLILRLSNFNSYDILIHCREWNRVCEESIVAKYTVMKSASDEFGEFKSLVAQVSVNLIKDSSQCNGYYLLCLIHLLPPGDCMAWQTWEKTGEISSNHCRRCWRNIRGDWKLLFAMNCFSNECAHPHF